MGSRKCAAFTLIELLVVLAVLALLVGLTLPAVTRAREASRRGNCTSRQRDLARAVFEFESARGRFPGWREQIGAAGSLKSASWLFALLPYTERRDLYRQYRPGGDRFDPVAWPVPVEYLTALVCPSDPPASTGETPTSYVANCGLPDGLAGPGREADYAANGLFHMLDPAAGMGTSLTTVTMAYVTRHDGAANTLLLTERVEAYRWTDFESEMQTGFLWQNTLAPSPAARINGLKPAPPESNRLDHVRPSSNHPGGVVAAYADGSVVFLDEATDYVVYCLQMTPNGSQAIDPAQRSPALAEFRTRSLD